MANGSPANSRRASFGFVVAMPFAAGAGCAAKAPGRTPPPDPPPLARKPSGNQPCGDSRARSAWFTAGVTNLATSPPSRAISLTSLDAIA